METKNKKGVLKFLESFLQLFDSKKAPAREPSERGLENEEHSVINLNEHTMINTISFSSDMECLYLIDNGRAIDFKLSGGQGVLIGTLKGQITVATAHAKPEETSPASLVKPSENPVTPADSTVKKAIDTKRIKLSTENAQWQLFYTQKHQTIFVIGASEIDSSLMGGRNPRPKIFSFKISDDNVIYMRRESNVIELQAM